MMIASAERACDRRRFAPADRPLRLGGVRVHVHESRWLEAPCAPAPPTVLSQGLVPFSS